MVASGSGGGGGGARSVGLALPARSLAGSLPPGLPFAAPLPRRLRAGVCGRAPGGRGEAARRSVPAPGGSEGERDARTAARARRAARSQPWTSRGCWRR